MECAVCHSPQHKIINLKNQNTRVLCAEVADGDPPLPAGYICHCCTCADEAFEPPRNEMEKSLKQRLPKDYYRFPQITFCLADQVQRDVAGKMFRRKLGARCNMIAIHAEDSEFKMTILARGAFLLDETLALKTELENADIVVRRIERRFPDSVTFDYTAD